MDKARFICVGRMDNYQFTSDHYKSVHASLDKVPPSFTHTFWTYFTRLDSVRGRYCVLSQKNDRGCRFTSNNGYDQLNTCTATYSWRAHSSYNAAMLQERMEDSKGAIPSTNSQIFCILFDPLVASCNHYRAFYLSYPDKSAALRYPFDLDKYRSVLDSPLPYGMSLQKETDINGAI